MPAIAAPISTTPRPRTAAGDEGRPIAEAAAVVPAGRRTFATPANARTRQAAANGPAAMLAIRWLLTRSALRVLAGVRGTAGVVPAALRASASLGRSPPTRRCGREAPTGGSRSRPGGWALGSALRAPFPRRHHLARVPRGPMCVVAFDRAERARDDVASGTGL